MRARAEMPTVVKKRLAQTRHPDPQTPKESAMNKTFVAAAVLALSAVAASAAGTDTPRIDQRQANQEQRIDQGIASGELTKREAHRMNRQQNAVNRAEDRAKADGVVTAQEKKRLTKAQNTTSKRIYRQKHDAQQRPGA
jgi:hypothetical protein